MKPFLVALLSFSILLNGCTSFYPLTNEDKSDGRPAEDEAMLVNLKDGRSIEVEPYHHVLVEEPSDLIYGVGERRLLTASGDYARGLAPQRVRGRLLQSAIDSSATNGGSLTCWLKDRTTIVYKENDYVQVTSEGGPGLWCVGQDQGGTTFRGRVPYEDISGFEIEKTDIAKTVLASIGVFLAVGAVIGAVVFAGWKPSLGTR